MTTAEASSAPRRFPCKGCGDGMEFDPNRGLLKCPRCQAESELVADGAPVEELDFEAALADPAAARESHETLTVRCETCGAESSLAPDVTAGRCPFCASPIVSQGLSAKRIKPLSVLPFAVPREAATKRFQDWLSSLWFAPSELARAAQAGRLVGVYLPYWTYDCRADSQYSGARGDDYQETETYTVHENGRPQTRTRTVTKTRWRPAVGRVSDSFDDVLVPAGGGLPSVLLDDLEPWDLESLVPYADGFLAGFVAESYRLELRQGFERAKERMAPRIDGTVRADIGGDRQRVYALRTRYEGIRFKHLLLPLWLSAYRYGTVTYRFMVNARTGEVAGERPYSPWKIAFAALLAALAAVLAWLWANP